MQEFIAQIQPGHDFRPHSLDDMLSAKNYSVHQLVKIKVSGIRKHRAYRQLCCYKGSCRYIADLNLDPNKNTKEKVDAFTKIKLGFIKGTFVDPYGGVAFIPDSLSYDNCDHPRATKFINAALEDHAELAGIKPDKNRTASDVYVAHLKSLGQGYDR